MIKLNELNPEQQALLDTFLSKTTPHELMTWLRTIPLKQRQTVFSLREILFHEQVNEIIQATPPEAWFEAKAVIAQIQINL